MKNRLLQITRDVIPYVKQLKIYLKNTNSCILMQQLDYWFSHYPDGFYKFKEPCEDPDYKIGDSWCEELIFTAEEFDNAFEKIGVKYKSKTDFLNATDKFKGKFYASFYERTTHKTYYVRNHETVDKFLDELCIKINNDADFPRNHESRFPETNKVGFQKPIKSVSIYRTETTTEITKERAPSAKVLKKKGERLSEDQELTAEWVETAKKIGVPVENIDLIFKSFKNYWLGEAGAKTYKLNWLRTWENWCIREITKFGVKPTKLSMGNSYDKPKQQPLVLSPTYSKLEYFSDEERKLQKKKISNEQGDDPFKSIYQVIPEASFNKEGKLK
jgi:hypothetical protein